MTELVTRLMDILWTLPEPADAALESQPEVGDVVATERGSATVLEVAPSPYDELLLAAYVVGDGWADWLPLVTLAALQ